MEVKNMYNAGDFENKNGWPLYKGVAVEKAELQEMQDWIKESVSKFECYFNSMITAIKFTIDSLSKFGEYFRPKYRTEEFIQHEAPEFWFKSKFGE